MRSPLFRRLIALAAAVCAAVLAGPVLVGPVSALTISVDHVPNLKQGQTTPLGRLTLVEAAILTADDENFGGFSALERFGDHWLTATDRGHWLAFDWAGPAVTVQHWGETPIDKTGLKNRGAATDAEALAIGPDGEILLAFEREHRIQKHRDLASKPATNVVPIALRAPAPLGFGIEAMTTLADGSLFAITEKVKRDGGFRAYRITGKRGGTQELYVYVPDGDWLPSAATTLPDGGILLAERKPTIFGFRARFLTLDPRQLTGEERAKLTPTLIARFAAGTLPSDNIEGIYARALTDGTTEITTISDDNFKGFQSTKLLRFILDGSQ